MRQLRKRQSSGAVYSFSYVSCLCAFEGGVVTYRKADEGEKVARDF